jgi:alpha-1,2-mannosyltransferase
LFWRLYFAPYETIQGYMAKRMRWRVLLTNSEYSRDVIRRHIGAEAIVVYPPVNIGEFLEAGRTPPEEREDIVVACGRFTPEKRHELVIEVARHLPDVEFHIVGATSGKVSPPYIARLRRLIERYGLRNVRLHVDYPRRDQVRLYSRAKVYIHAMIGEHFGIAVVEAMAAGLVPVVHRSGGPWNDITYQGRYGLGYNTVEEAVEAVEKALKDYPRLSKKAQARAMEFSHERFKERFKHIVESLILRSQNGYARV